MKHSDSYGLSHLLGKCLFALFSSGSPLKQFSLLYNEIAIVKAKPCIDVAFSNGEWQKHFVLKDCTSNYLFVRKGILSTDTAFCTFLVT